MELTWKEWLSQNLKGDRQVWWIVGILMIISILAVYTATGAEGAKSMPEALLFKHIMHLGLAAVAMFVAHKIDYIHYSRISELGVWISVPLLLWAKFGGVELNEAHRWVKIGFVSFQPSDLAKVCLIAFLATMLAKRQRVEYKDNIFVNFWMQVIWCVVICGLIGMSNASNGMLLLLTCFVVMYIGRVPAKQLITLILVGSLCIGAGIYFGKERLGTVKTRVENFVNSWQGGKPEWQVAEGYKAFANGGITGVGPGNSHQRNSIPYGYAEYIYPIIVEEYGIIGAVSVLAVFLWLLYRGVKILSKTDRALKGLLVAGLTTSLVLQALFNLAVTVELFPTTGLTLPLISMGGTSLLFTGLSLGIILSASKQEETEAE